MAEVFPSEVLEDFEPLLRRADRMGMTTSQMEMQLPRGSLNVAVTVAMLKHKGEGSGYVIVFEDLSDLLKAQKQAAWREVARRVAHEIKNPLTPIALSAERIQRHLDRAKPADAAALGVVRSCAETIAEAVETVRQLVDEFSTLARFPVAKPEPADINEVIESVLSITSLMSAGPGLATGKRARVANSSTRRRTVSTAPAIVSAQERTTEEDAGSAGFPRSRCR